MSERIVQYEIRVTVKTLNGVFGSKSKSETFFFCTSEPRDEALHMAARNVPSQGWPYDERSVQVIGQLHVRDEVERIAEEAKYLDPLPMVHAPIKSLREAQSERDAEAEDLKTEAA